MPRSALWFAIAFAWWLDAGLALLRHHRSQAALAALAACAFFATGLYFNTRDRSRR
jgi:hypothetical protein